MYRFFGKKKDGWLLKTLPWVVCLFLWGILFVLVPDNANKLELAFYDFLSTKNPHQIKNDRVVIVGVDQESVDRIGPMPWPRRYHSYLLANIGQADVIGMDLLFSEANETDPESDDVFAQAMRTSGKVTLPYVYHPNTSSPYGQIAPLFRYSANSIGYVNNFLVDSDNVVRRLYFANKQPNVSSDIMSFTEALLLQQNLEPKKKKNVIQQFFLMFGDNDKSMIPYNNDQNAFPIFSYDQILRGEVNPDFFKGKIVLVGSTAISLQDRHSTPSLAFGGDLSGVLILANVTNAMIHDDLILIPSSKALLIISIFLFVVLAIISFFIKGEYYFLHYFCYALFLLFFSAFLLFYGQVWFPIVTLACLVICVGLGRALIQRSSFRFMAYTDALTGLANRHAFELRFARILDVAYRKKMPTTFILMDIDFFKKYNDTYGHDAGDVVLKAIGDVLFSQQKKGEVAARLGGEEFALVIPNCNAEQAYERAESIRKAIHALNIEHKTSSIQVVSASFGASVDGNGSAHLNNKIHYQEADIALYDVKSESRNAVKVRSFTVVNNGNQSQAGSVSYKT